MEPYIIRLRRGTDAQWTAANPILSSGEPGYVTDLNQYKIGDGVTDWANLPYTTGPAGPPGDPGVQGPPGEVEEAPSDGSLYVRQNGTWAVLLNSGGIPDVPDNGVAYVRRFNSWVDADNRFEFKSAAASSHNTLQNNINGKENVGVASALLTVHTNAANPHGQYLTDAPNDGLQYARQNGLWAEVSGGGGGGGIPDAPADSVYYGRRNASWVNLDSTFLRPAEILAGANVQVDLATTPGSAIVGVAMNHNDLGLLGGDDHTQYALTDGTRGAFATQAQGALADTAVQQDNTYTSPITRIMPLTQIEYDAIGTPDVNTLYLIV